jgi:uncharacterized membrane-anchored protein
MIQFLRNPAMGLIAAGVVLTGILGGMVYDRTRLLKTGREIVLPIQPVDPRDLFKGDYVRLGYAISAAPKDAIKGLPSSGANQRVFVTLEQASPTADWQVAAVTATRPTTQGPNQIMLAAKLTHRGLSYGLERYYVPEGTGPKLEAKARLDNLSAIVAVDAKGRAAIKGLMYEGLKIYDEPLL